jgi:hypothetical protein
MFAGMREVGGNPVEGSDAEQNLRALRLARGIEEVQRVLGDMGSDEKKREFEKYPGLDALVYAQTQNPEQK